LLAGRAGIGVAGLPQSVQSDPVTRQILDLEEVAPANDLAKLGRRLPAPHPGWGVPPEILTITLRQIVPRGSRRLSLPEPANKPATEFPGGADIRIGSAMAIVVHMDVQSPRRL
jgi:hypothetical protein